MAEKQYTFRIPPEDMQRLDEVVEDLRDQLPFCFYKRYGRSTIIRLGISILYKKMKRRQQLDQEEKNS